MIIISLLQRFNQAVLVLLTTKTIFYTFCTMVSCPSSNMCCWACYHKYSCFSHLSSPVSIDCCCWTCCCKWLRSFLCCFSQPFTVVVDAVLDPVVFLACNIKEGNGGECTHTYLVYSHTYQGHSQSADLIYCQPCSSGPRLHRATEAMHSWWV